MQTQHLSVFQDQRLKMNPQMFQSLKLMELPVIDLREKISLELERNPALEILEDRSIVSLDDTDIQPQDEENDYFETSSDSGFIRQGGQAASDEQRRFIEGVLSRPETLQEHLLWQLQLQLEPVNSDLRAIAEILIQNLDEDGFHKEPPETLFRQSDMFPALPPQQLDEALKLVQSLDPVGCCVSGYRESLKVQANLLFSSVPEIGEALKHLDLFEKEKFVELGRIMNCDEDDIRWFYEIIKRLSPFPGRQSALTEVRYVVPDIQIVRDGDEFVIILNEEEIPVLGLNPFFMKIAAGRKTDKSSAPDDEQSEESDSIETTAAVSRPARDFARENIKEARWFIQSVNLRNHTLLRVTRAILEFQRPFFVNGSKYLVPLTLGDIAKALGVHEATVSRTAHGKYIQTEWGIFELRYFFTNSISGAGSGGSQFSKAGVKATIQELVSTENRTLTDQEITGILAQRGIMLARRTVSKYRKELDLGSSYTR